MPIPLIDAIRRVRSNLDESASPSFNEFNLVNPIPSPVARFFTDTEITDWLNDGLRDIARRAEILFTTDSTIQVPAFTPSSLSPGPPVYNLLDDVIRLYRVEFVPVQQTNQIYRVEPSTQNEMDQIWGTYQQNTSTYPRWYITQGYPGGTGRNNFVLQLYPAPSQPGTLNCYYYRQPIRLGDPISNPGNYNITLDLIEGWDDVPITFATMRALQKQRSQQWQDYKKDYEEMIAQMMDVTRRFHDQQSYISYGTNMLPSWLVGGGEY